MKKKLLSLQMLEINLFKLQKIVAESSEIHIVLVTTPCSKGYLNFQLIVKIVFRCFAKNELKQLDYTNIETPSKMVCNI